MLSRQQEAADRIVSEKVSGSRHVELAGMVNDIRTQALFHTNFARLIELRKKAMEILQNHYEHGCGYNWNIGLINPPMQEPSHNEHYVSFTLDVVVREKKSNN